MRLTRINPSGLDESISFLEKSEVQRIAEIFDKFQLKYLGRQEVDGCKVNLSGVITHLMSMIGEEDSRAYDYRSLHPFSDVTADDREYLAICKLPKSEERLYNEQRVTKEGLTDANTWDPERVIYCYITRKQDKQGLDFGIFECIENRIENMHQIASINYEE